MFCRNYDEGEISESNSSFSKVCDSDCSLCCSDLKSIYMVESCSDQYSKSKDQYFDSSKISGKRYKVPLFDVDK